MKRAHREKSLTGASLAGRNATQLQRRQVLTKLSGHGPQQRRVPSSLAADYATCGSHNNKSREATTTMSDERNIERSWPKSDGMAWRLSATTSCAADCHQPTSNHAVAKVCSRGMASVGPPSYVAWRMSTGQRATSHAIVVPAPSSSCLSGVLASAHASSQACP